MSDASGLVGRRIGPYQVLALLGSGGMGEVYRAYDGRLERSVALKVLRPALAADPDLMARLGREARVLAALSHPHIAAIYGIEDIPADSGADTGARALVLELIDGETLADRVARAAACGPGGLSVAESIDVASQIVSALDSAHERGIVHRDLKPANVKLTSEQVVKVLDFGLAKAVDSIDASRSPTITSGSHDGMLLGTPAYMSPEQVRGKPVDKRTDIWAFGCVLYELLTGRPAFARTTIADTIAAVLGHEPDWNALPHSTPESLRHLLRLCLAKDSKHRLRDIGDARFDGAAPDVAAASSRASGNGGVSEIHFQRLTDFPGVNEYPAISPDGKMVAFSAHSSGRRHLFTVLLSGGAPLQVTRDEVHHDHPRWAPDSGAIIYFTPPEESDESGTLWEIPALGGTPRPIVAALGSGDISRSGRIAFFRLRSGSQELVTVARDGSDPQVASTIPSGLPCKSPRWSPDERWIAFQWSSVFQFKEQLSIVPAGGGPPRVVTSSGSMNGVSWLPDGAGLVYSSSLGSTIPYPRTCNLRLIRTNGSDDRQLTFGDTSLVQPDVHHSGKLLACRIRSASDIWKFPTLGTPADNVRHAVRITNQTGQVQTPSVSPDGLEVVFLSDNGAHANLWVSRTDGSNCRQLTFERDRSVTIGAPLWSPAGNPIAFVVSRATPEIWVIDRNGRGRRQLVPEGFAACWSLDGKWLYYVTGADAPSWRIEKIPVEGGSPVCVRDQGFVHGPVVGPAAFYFSTWPDHGTTNVNWTVRRALSDGGPAEPIAHIDGLRLPVSSGFAQGTLSPDGKDIALPLIDGAATNIWILPTAGGPSRRLTDFEGRSVLIARQVSWAPDGQFIYAAVAEIGADVVMYDGLLQGATSA